MCVYRHSSIVGESAVGHAVGIAILRAEHTVHCTHGVTQDKSLA